MRSGLYEHVLSLPEPERVALLKGILADPEARRNIALSFAQRQLWFMQQMQPGSPVYNSPAVYRFRGVLKTEALEEALAALCRRHEVLRSRFLDVAGEPVALISASGPAFQVMDLRESAPATGEDASSLVTAEATRPFRLSDEPLVRCTVAVLRDDEYLVILNIHHIVVDGWSLDIIWREIAHFYRGIVSGRPQKLPALAFQYADFVAWQDDMIRDGRAEQEFAYWREELAGAPAALDLPLDRPRPSRPTFDGGSVTASLSPSLVRRVVEIASGQGASPLMAFHAAYAAVLSAYSGQQTILTGLPEAGRGRPEFEGLAGMFMNMIVLRTDLSGGPTFNELVRRTRAAALGAYKHAKLPFEKLVQWLGAGRDLDRNPVFQAFFAYHPAGQQRIELGEATGELLEVPVSAVGFDLDLAVHAREDGSADVSLGYPADLFDPVTAERILRCFVRLTEGVSRQPSTPLPDLEWVAEPGRTATRETPEPAVQRLREFLAQGVACFPERIAIRQGGHALTYRELDESSSRLARHLLAQGATPDLPLGLDLRHGPDMLVAVAAILKTGSGYVPLDAISGDQLPFVLFRSRVPIVITESGHRSRYSAYQGIVVLLDESGPLAQYPATPPSVEADPQSVACALYSYDQADTLTCTTMTHYAVAALAGRLRGMLGPEEVARVLVPAGSGLALVEHLVTLMLGGTVIVTGPGPDLRQLPDAISMIVATPDVVRHVIDLGPLPGGLAVIVMHGEPPSAALVERVYAAGPVRRLIGIHGAASCPAGSLWSTPERGSCFRAMGEPLPGIRCSVLDQWQRPVPPGARGELYLAGPGLLPGTNLYRTGDLVRYRADGQLEYLGRADRELTVRGCRVDPGEVESILRDHSQVAQAAVIGRPVDGECQLAAYVVPRAGDTVPDGLTQHLARRLPRYLLPASVTALASLPLDRRGELDMTALPGLVRAGGEPAERVAPRNVTEERLAAIWRNLLGQPEIGVHDDFFALGGESLLAMQVVAHIKQDFGMSVPVSAMFETPTVAGLAELVASSAPAPSPSLTQMARLRPMVTPVTPLRRGGTRPPIVLVHGISGDTLPYSDLSRVLHDGRPVYGVPAQGLDREVQPLAAVPEMASHYLDQLAAANLTGPMVLAGWSMGGAVAYEMACQATARGLAVALLLLDAQLEATGHPRDELELAAVYGRHLLGMAGAGSELISSLDGTGAGASAKQPDAVAVLLDWGRAHGVLSPETTEVQVRRTLRVIGANLRALENYSPGPLHAPALYLMASEAASGDPAEPLRRLLGKGLLLLPAPGGHHAMLRQPHVVGTARLIDTWLDRLGY